MRRLLALAEAPDPDVVREALLSELTTVLTLDSVTVVPSGQAEPRIIDVRRIPGRSVMLEYSSRGGYETVELAAYQQPGLDRDELEIATAIVQAAAVVLRLVRSQRDAATDELTGCLNRRAMLERLEEETARSQREHAPLATLMLDVDNLKQINDSFGHLEGDRVRASSERSPALSCGATTSRLATAATSSSSCCPASLSPRRLSPGYD